MNPRVRHRSEYFDGARGVRIHWQSWGLDGDAVQARAAVVIAHGAGEHGGRYQRLAEILVKHGLVVYAIDHRGHGRSGGSRARIDRFSEASSDLDRLVDHAREERRASRTFLLGHSLGGAVALDYALRNQAKLHGLILSGPAVAIDGASPGMLAVSRALSRIAPWLGLVTIDPQAISNDLGEVAAYAADPLNHHGKVPAGTLGEVVRFAQRLPSRLPALTLPLLILHGEDDRLAGVSGSKMIMENVGSRDKLLRVYPGLRHEIFNEIPDARAEVFADLQSWLSDH